MPESWSAEGGPGLKVRRFPVPCGIGHIGGVRSVLSPLLIIDFGAGSVASRYANCEPGDHEPALERDSRQYSPDTSVRHEIRDIVMVVP